MHVNLLRKWLIVGISTVSVILLILTSLSNVVGYQSVKSTVNDTPLFNIRTQRATNQKQNVLTSQYLGMGKENEFKVFIPSRNNERILLQKALNRLHGMDDATFTKFLEQVLFWVSTNDEYKEENVPQLIFTLHQLKENPQIFERYLTSNNDDLTMGDYPSVYAWFPGCILFEIITLILLIIYSIIGPTLLPTCHYCPHLYQ